MDDKADVKFEFHVNFACTIYLYNVLYGVCSFVCVCVDCTIQYVDAYEVFVCVEDVDGRAVCLVGFQYNTYIVYLHHFMYI